MKAMEKNGKAKQKGKQSCLALRQRKKEKKVNCVWFFELDEEKKCIILKIKFKKNR